MVRWYWVFFSLGWSEVRKSSSGLMWIVVSELAVGGRAGVCWAGGGESESQPC